MVEALDRLLRSKLRAQTAPVVLALDGRSGVGKSTLAAYLAQRFDTQLVEGDDFFQGGPQMRSESAEELSNLCIDWRRLHDALSSLRAGQVHLFNPFDWNAFDGSLCQQARELQPRPLIIHEGVYAGRTELRDVTDIRVLLVADDAIRDERLRQREGEIGDWERQWQSAEAWYFEHKALASSFDMVINSADLAFEQ